MLSNKQQFFYNLLANYGLTIISSILAFVSVPIALNYWGAEVYGIWTILMSFSTYIMASGLGIDVSTCLLMTKNSDIGVKISIFKKGIKILLICSSIILILAIFITLCFPDWFKIIGKMDESNYKSAKISAIIFIIGIIINLPLSGIANTLASFGKAYLNSGISIFQVIFNFLLIVLTPIIQLSLPLYVFFYTCITILCSLSKDFVVFLCIRNAKNNALNTNFNGINHVPDNSYKAILRMGVNLSLQGFASMIVPNISNLVISNNIDVKAIVPYSLSYKLYSIMCTFVSHSNNAIGPILGDKYGKNEWNWLETNYKRMFKITVPLAIFVVLGVIWGSRPFVCLWTGSLDNYAGSVISILLGLYFLNSCMNNLNIVITNSFNYTNKLWLISWSEGAIFLVTSIFLTKKIGVVGVPLSLCLGAYLVSSWAYPYVIYKRTQKRFLYDFKYFVKNLLVLFTSLIAFVFISNFKLGFYYSTLFEIVGMIFTTIALFLILPKEIKNVLCSKFRRNK